MHAYGDLEEIVKNAINKEFIMYRNTCQDLDYPEEVEVNDQSNWLFVG